MPDTETVQEGGDDLRSVLTAAMQEPDENTEIETVDSELPDEDPLEEKGDRDDKGRFKKKEEPVEEKPEDQQELDTEKKPDIAPPQHWKGSGKVDWNKLPAAVKQAIADDYKAFEETKGRFNGLEQVLEPRRIALQATYGSVENAVNQLFQLSDFAERDPQGFVQWFAQQRGVSLQAPQAGQQPQDGGTPELLAAMQKIAELEKQITQLPVQLQQQSQNTQLQSQIQAFASDPAHPYFEDVKTIMGGLLQTGAAQTLDDAYNQAIYAVPHVREQLLAQQRESEAEEKRKKAEAAKRAASSMSGSPVTGASITDEPAGSVREEIIRSMNASRV